MKKKNFSIFYLVLFIFLAIYVALILTIFGWGFMTSFKDQYDEGFGYFFDTLSFPRVWYFSHYADVITQLKVTIDGGVYTLGQMLVNTILYTFGTSFVSTLVPCVVAYLIATYDKFAFSKIVYGFVIITMILPIVGATPSVIQVLRTLRYYDNIVGMWLMNFNFLVGIHFLVFYDAFKGVSVTYKEAAEIDGASQLKTMVSIVMPLVRNIFITILILRFIAYWNDYQTPLLYMPHKPTVAYGIFKFFFQAQDNRFEPVPMKLTGAFIVAIPIIVLFVLCQKRIMQNVTMGGIKE